MSEEIKVYIADLAAYNNGILHGVWINGCDELGDIQEQIDAMLKNSPVGFAEEHAIHDHEGFSGYRLGEYESIKTVHEIACFIDENSEIGGELLSYFDGNLEEAQTAIDDNYNGCYSSIADYAQMLTEESNQIPEHLTFYIDYERMGRDMEMSGDIFTIETAIDEVHIFWSH